MSLKLRPDTHHYISSRLKTYTFYATSPIIYTTTFENTHETDTFETPFTTDP